jgi:hypothetical protein
MTIHHQEQEMIPGPITSLAASKKALVSVGSRKSLGRRSVVLTLSDLTGSSIGANSLWFCGMAERNSQQNLDIVELRRRSAASLSGG